MAAPKGNKFAGSRKGIPNKKTEQWDTFSEYCLDGGLEKFKNELDTLKGEKYINAFLALLEYHKPKLARTTLEGDKDNPINMAPIIQILPPNDPNKP